MAEVCKKHNIKLLTYGTLCGGLLAEKWIGQEPPDLYSDEATPSLRKVCHSKYPIKQPCLVSSNI
jgi:aryl-alcohol dehydrogenase-like predicted oxidoreductase